MMDNLQRFIPEMTIGLIWFVGGLFLGWLVLAWVMLPEWALRSKQPERTVYQWTLNGLWLHLLVGLVIGIYQYAVWYYNRTPMDSIQSSWPLILFYLVCFGIDFFLIFRFFIPPHRNYSRGYVKQK